MMTEKRQARFDELKEGMVLIADSGFTCIPAGEHVVRKDENGFYLACNDGRPGCHYLDGQKRDDGLLEGLSRRPLKKFAVAVNVVYDEVFVVEAEDDEDAREAYYEGCSPDGEGMIARHFKTSEIDAVVEATDEQITKATVRA
jgi:hypothetical protein